MTEHHRQHPKASIAERAIVLQLLRDDHDERWSHTELQAEINHTEPSALSSAVERLEQHGVVVASLDGYILASRCARHLDELGLMSV
jgi:hypothetical protein